MRHPRPAPNEKSIGTEIWTSYPVGVFKDFLYMSMEERKPQSEEIGVWNNIPKTIDTILKEKFNINATHITQGELSELVVFLNDQIRILTRSYSQKSNGFIEALIACVKQFERHPHVSLVQAIKIKRKNRANTILHDIRVNTERDPIALDAMKSIPNLPGFEYFYYKKYTGKTVTKRVIENGTAINREYAPVMAIWRKAGKPERFAGRLLMHFPIEPGNVDIHWSERLFQEKKTTTREEVDDTSTTEENWTIRKYELKHEVNQELQGEGFLYASGEKCMNQEIAYLGKQQAEYEKKKPEREFLESIKQSSTRIQPSIQDLINPVIDPYLEDDNFSPENHVLEVPGLSHFFFRFPKNPAYTPGKVRIFAAWNSNLKNKQPWHRGYMTIQWPIVDQANPLVVINDEKENIHILPEEKTGIPDSDGGNLLLPFIQQVVVEGPQAGPESSAPKPGENTQAQSMEEGAPKVITESANTKPISPNVIRNLASSSLNGAHISLDIDGYDEFIITPLGGVSNHTSEAFQQGYMPASIRWRKNDATKDESHIVRINPAINPENPVLQIDPMYVKKQNVVENTWEEKLGVMDQETFRINQIRSNQTKWKRSEDSKQREQMGREVEIVPELERGDINNHDTSGITVDEATQQSGPNAIVATESVPGGEAAIVEGQQGPSEKQESEKGTQEKGTQPEKNPSLVSRAGGWLRNTFSKFFGGIK